MKKIIRKALLTISTAAVLVGTQLSFAEPFIGEVAWVPYNFNPRGWANCDGQLLAISQNTALFSLLGTTYGGDGRTTFGLPDLRGRVAMHTGTGPGLSSRSMGQEGGQEIVALNQTQMPSHNHALQASSNSPTSTDPTGNVPASPSRSKIYGATPNAQMDVAAIGNTGGGQAHNNMQPYTVLRCIIATQGIFPSRN